MVFNIAMGIVLAVILLVMLIAAIPLLLSALAASIESLASVKATTYFQIGVAGCLFYFLYLWESRDFEVALGFLGFLAGIAGIVVLFIGTILFGSWVRRKYGIQGLDAVIVLSLVVFLFLYGLEEYNICSNSSIAPSYSRCNKYK